MATNPTRLRQMIECLGEPCHNLPPNILSWQFKKVIGEEYQLCGLGSLGRKKKEKVHRKEVYFLPYLLQLPLLGLVSTCSFLSFSCIIPLSSSREHCAVLPLHWQLQLQQVEGWAAARLEQGCGCLVSTSSRLWRWGAGWVLHRGLWSFRRWREVERRSHVACLRSKVVLGVKLVLNAEGRWSCEGVLTWKHTLTKRLCLGGEAPSLCLVHWLWWWRAWCHLWVHVVGQH